MASKAENTAVSELAPEDPTVTASDPEVASLKRKRPSPERKRLNLDLTPAAYDLLQELSEESGKNMAEVLRTGLALYGIAQEEKRKGRYLGVMEDDRVIRQIVLP